jgi:membrane protein
MQRIKSVFRFYGNILKEAIDRFVREDVLTQSAALSYYMIFSLPSILVIILWIAARFYRETAVREAIFSEIGALVGEDGAKQLMGTIEGLNIQDPSWWATFISIGVLIFTATTVLVTIQTTLNRIFEINSVTEEGLGLWRMLCDRFVSFGLIVTVAFILLVSLFVDAMISTLGEYLERWAGEMTPYVMAFDTVLLDLVATTVLLAMVLRYLPAVKMKWKDTWFGALLITGLFTVGKYLVGFIIGNSEIADLYDAAGSVLVIMLWVYYASAIFLFGATFTFVRARRSGNLDKKENFGADDRAGSERPLGGMDGLNALDKVGL